MIDLSSLVDSTLLLEVVEQGAFALLRPQPGQAQALKDALVGAAHMTVWLKEEIPERYHIKHNRRVMPVFALADEGWKIVEVGCLMEDCGGELFSGRLWRWVVKWKIVEVVVKWKIVEVGC